jgi:hypothetical protein
LYLRIYLSHNVDRVREYPHDLRGRQQSLSKEGGGLCNDDSSLQTTASCKDLTLVTIGNNNSFALKLVYE